MKLLLMKRYITQTATDNSCLLNPGSLLQNTGYCRP